MNFRKITPAAIFSWLAVVFFSALFLTPALYPDPAHGLLAALQEIHGVSPSPSSTVQADVCHNGDAQIHRITWWPPSYQFLPWAFMKWLKLSIGDAVRVTTILLLITGLCGWGAYFITVLGKSGGRIALGLLSTWRFVHNNVFFYDGGELLLFAAAPWVLLLIGRAVTGEKISVAVFAGLGCGSLFALKYSSAPIILAWCAAAGLALFFEKQKHAAAKSLALTASCFTTLFLIWAAFISGGNTPSDRGLRAGWNFLEVLWHWLCWPLTLGDLDALGRFFLLSDASQERDLLKLAWIGLATLLAILPILFISDKTFSMQINKLRFYLLAGITSLIATLLLISILGVMGGALSWEARYYRIPVLVMFPFLVGIILKVLKNKSLLDKLLITPITLLLIVTSIYGLTAFAKKTTVQLSDAKINNTTWQELTLPIVDNDTPITIVISQVEEYLNENPQRVLLVGDVRLALPFATRRFFVWNSQLPQSDCFSSGKGRPHLAALINTKALRAEPSSNTIKSLTGWEINNVIVIEGNWLIYAIDPSN